ncbi:MAG: hypothetical protein Q9195_000717 [Heterodermia aff. obscurata]
MQRKSDDASVLQLVCQGDRKQYDCCFGCSIRFERLIRRSILDSVSLKTASAYEDLTSKFQSLSRISDIRCAELDTLTILEPGPAAKIFGMIKFSVSSNSRKRWGKMLARPVFDMHRGRGEEKIGPETPTVELLHALINFGSGFPHGVLAAQIKGYKIRLDSRVCGFDTFDDGLNLFQGATRKNDL